jgi:hypothetical protein
VVVYGRRKEVMETPSARTHTYQLSISFDFKTKIKKALIYCDFG